MMELSTMASVWLFSYPLHANKIVTKQNRLSAKIAKRSHNPEVSIFGTVVMITWMFVHITGSLGG